eukprot:1175658-Prorocentrum_minimum.AAC.1
MPHGAKRTFIIGIRHGVPFVDALRLGAAGVGRVEGARRMERLQSGRRYQVPRPTVHRAHDVWPAMPRGAPQIHIRRGSIHIRRGSIHIRR